MKYLIFVQDNGRGHLSQAITLKEKLTAAGHEVLGAAVGTKNDAEIPSFFKEQFAGPIFTFASPYLINDKQNQGINIGASIWQSLLHLPRYRKSMVIIGDVIKKLSPDILINCYEPMIGTYYRLYRPTQPLFCIAHQYFIDHPAFKFPKISLLHKISFRLYNYFTAPAAATRIALSFTEENDLSNQKLKICPPLIRPIIKNGQPQQNDFILTYILNPGYGQDIAAWCKNNPNFKVEAFREQPEEIFQAGTNLIFHALSGEKFIQRLLSCSAYASTGGFESISEAAYLQKNILMVPTKGHFEQKCNAADAQRAGLAHTATHFHLDVLTLPKTKTHSAGQAVFKEWVDKYEDKIIKILES
jgi:uncharacterized protein (TIGR00661 family)